MQNFYEGLLNKVQVRRFELLEQLYYSCTPIKSSDLTQKFGVSEQVIQKDIYYLNEHADGKFEAFYSSYECSLVSDPAYNFKEIGNVFIREWTQYHIFDVIFYNEHLKIEDLAVDFDLSITTLYLLARKYNEKLLPKFNIQLQTNPFKLVGEEAYIRSFYTQYFFEHYNSLSFPFTDSKNSEKFNQFVNLFLGEIEDEYLINSDYIKLNIWVNIIRALKGYELDFSSKKSQISLDKLEPEVKESAKILFSDIFNTELTTHICQQAFYTWVQYPISYTYDSLLKVAEQNSQIQDSIEWLIDKIKQLKDKYNLKTKCEKSLILHLHNAVYLHKELPALRFITFDTFGRFTSILEQRFPSFVEDIKNISESFQMLVHHEVNEFLTMQLVNIFLSSWTHLIQTLEDNGEKVVVAILSDLGLNYARIMQDLLHQFIPNFIESKVYDLSLLNTQELVKIEADVIITNFHISPFKDTITIAIDDFPSEVDMSKIIDTIYPIYQSRLTSTNKKTIEF